MANIKYLKNEKLETIKAGFAGVPSKRGRFVGNFDARSGRAKGRLGASVQFVRRSFRRELHAETSSVAILRDRGFLSSKSPGIIWLGHASFLINLGGKRLLIDPCFSDIPFKRRLSPAPFHIRELGTIDYLLISHGHHDHLDARTIRAAGGAIREALVPLKMGRLIRRANGVVPVQEAGWYQKYETDGVEVFLLPAYHWHRRTAFDYNRVLWGSFIIRGGGKTVYFAGDSGYNVHFKEIGEMFAIDYAIVPINPPYVVGGSHMNHAECLQALRDLKAKHYIPMHYGTFKLTVESANELAAWFGTLGEHEGVGGRILLPTMGEAIWL